MKFRIPFLFVLFLSSFATITYGQPFNFNWVNLAPGTTITNSRSSITINSPRGVDFTNQNSSQTSGFLYLFGDGFFSYNPNPVHEFFESGTYDVVMRSDARYDGPGTPSKIVSNTVIVPQTATPTTGSSTAGTMLSGNRPIQVGTSWPLIPGKDVIYIVPIQNLTGVAASGTVRIELDQHVQFLQMLDPNPSTHADLNWRTPGSLVHNTIGQNREEVSCQFTNLLPGELRVYYFMVHIPQSLNRQNVTANVSADINGFVTASNTERALRPKDPNYIIVDHEMIPAFKPSQTLTYEVGFENVGDWFIEDVYVDVIFDNYQDLDLSSLQLVHSSTDIDNVNIVEIGDNTLRFYFNDIFLPGMTQPTCHNVFGPSSPGTPPCNAIYTPDQCRADFSFTVCTQPYLEPGISLGVQADITFVGTSTIPASPPALTTVEAMELLDVPSCSLDWVDGLVSSGNHQTQKHTPANVFPNPFNSTLNISYSLAGDQAAPVNIQLINSSGQLVHRIYEGYQEKGDYTRSYPTDHIVPGIYILQIDNGISITNQRIVKL